MSRGEQDTKKHCTMSYAFAFASVFLPALLDFLQFSLDDGQLYGQGNSFSPYCFWLLQQKAKEDRPLNEYSVSVCQKGKKITQKYN